MNEDLQKQLVKQLKILNFWVRFFGVIVIICLIVVGYLLFRVAWFIKDTNDKFNNLQEQTTGQLDVKKQVCEGSGSFADFVKNNTDACR
ncbi:MAG: hypothetical protein M3Q70_01030 [bacterium]|nr:hypothetical protein [bacterium]